MQPAEVVASVAAPVGDLGRLFMTDPTTDALGQAKGLPDRWAFYVAGRGGVLGDVEPDVVAAGMGFVHPDMVAEHWNTGLAVMPARVCGALYAQAAQEYGRQLFSDLDGIDRLATMIERVVDAAEGSGLSLFAAWRADARPADAPAKAMQLLHTLREYRGSAHVIAIAAVGLTPIEAIMANDSGGGSGGKFRAERFGWPKPWPDGQAHRVARMAAETTTAKMITPAHATLDEDERRDFVDLVMAAHAAAEAAAPS